MKIAICDNDKDTTLCIMRQVKEISGTIQTECYTTFPSLEQLKEEEYDAILMDIDWDQKDNGIDFAAELSRMGNTAKIIYVSAYAEKFIEALFLNETNVVGFLTKPVNADNLKKYLIKVKEQMKAEKSNVLKVKENGRQLALRLTDILYIESKDHYMDIVTVNKKYHVPGTMTSLEKTLPEEFVRCHRGFIVNMEFITEQSITSLILKDNITVPVGRRYQKTLKESYISYLAKQI